MCRFPKEVGEEREESILADDNNALASLPFPMTTFFLRLQDIIHMYKMQQSTIVRMKSHEELETPSYTTSVPT